MGLLLIELSVTGPFSAETSEWLQIIAVFFFLPTFYTVIIYLFSVLGDSPLVKDADEETKTQSPTKAIVQQGLTKRSLHYFFDSVPAQLLLL